MRKRKLFLQLLGLWVAGSIAAAPVFAGEVKTKEPSSPLRALKKKYVYSEREKEAIRFFPVEKARWNGYEVTAGEWDQLSYFLKMRFLRDARTEIEVRENSVILVNDMDRLVKAMNESLKELQADPKLKEMPAITFFHVMLLRNNAIKKAWTLVKLSKPKTKPKDPTSGQR